MAESKDEALVRATYAKLEKQLRAICAAGGVAVQPDEGDKYPSIRVHKYSARATFSMHIYKRDGGDFVFLLSMRPTE